MLSEIDTYLLVKESEGRAVSTIGNVRLGGECVIPSHSPPDRRTPPMGSGVDSLIERCN